MKEIFDVWLIIQILYKYYEIKNQIKTFAL